MNLVLSTLAVIQMLVLMSSLLWLERLLHMLCVFFYALSAVDSVQNEFRKPQGNAEIKEIDN